LRIDWLPLERLAEVQRFIDDRWRTGHVLAQDEELLRWQHRSLADPDRLAILGAEEDGELVGMLGLIEFEACFGDRRGRGAWMTNWLVMPERRGEGIGSALAERACSEYELVGALDANEATRDALAGSFVERPILRWALPYNLVAMPGEPEWLDESAPPAGAFAGACRDEEFIGWRYRNHPRFEYTVLDGFAAVLDGFAAFRLAGDVLRVVDFLGDEGLAERVADEGRRVGAVYAEFLCHAPAYGAPLEAVGFRRARSLPSRFEPLDLRPRPDISCFRGFDGDLYVTAADSDLDRPNSL
jgi:GNAT superfamily N-acetyltransferase